MAQPEDLLIEIGTEELPPSALLTLSSAFAGGLEQQLAEHKLGHGQMRRYATPRRLALVVDAVAMEQDNEERVRRGPAVAAAFDSAGAPTKAALGFARSCGVEVEALEREETPKGAWLVHRQRVAGQSTRDLLPGLIEAALAQLPIPKRMRWGERDTEFVRPVQWVCVLLGSDSVPGEVLGLSIGRESRGHRFHHPQSIRIEAPATYAEQLRAAQVEPDFAARRAQIESGVRALAQSVSGEAAIPGTLLDEVTALCEWPVPLLGEFDPAFLEVPPEALIETMQKNQKYFPVLDADGRLRPFFVTVANIESRAPELVRAGNERVIRPRFADAMFFWQQDRKKPLADHQSALANVVFQQRLGSLWDKSRRTAALAAQIAEALGEDVSLAERAALLAKCDLLTAMVGEFASLQGIMGRYYAGHDGEHPCVAQALEEQYLPRHAGDRLPESSCGRVLALADKLDTLVGIFAIGQRPTGVKDPYGLRRAAIGILRLLIEIPLGLDLRDLLTRAAAAFPAALEAEAAVPAVLEYVLERLPGYYAEEGVSQDVVAAVLGSGSTAPSDIDQRIAAVQAFQRLDSAEALAAANKRIRNILKKTDVPDDATIDDARLEEPAERDLAERVRQMQDAITPLLAGRDYSAVLQTLAGLRPAVDAFFDEVMVMTDDQALRNNRIALLRTLEGLFGRVADISLLRPRQGATEAGAGGAGTGGAGS